MTTITLKNKLLAGLFSVLIIGANVAWAPAATPVDDNVLKTIEQYENSPAQGNATPTITQHPAVTPQPSASVPAAQPVLILPKQKAPSLQAEPKIENRFTQPAPIVIQAKPVVVETKPAVAENKPVQLTQKKIENKILEAKAAVVGKDDLTIFEKLVILALVTLALATFMLWRSASDLETSVNEQLSDAKKTMDAFISTAAIADKTAKPKLPAAKVTVARDDDEDNEEAA